MVALDDGVHDGLILAVHQREHLSDASLRVAEAVAMQEFEDADDFNGVRYRLRTQHHDKQHASVVHLGQELSQLKVRVLDRLRVL